MTPAQWLARFEEFKSTSPVIVAAHLADALTIMGGPDFSVWPPLASPGQPLTLTDLAQGYAAAMFLAGSPSGSERRIDPTKGNGKTPYSQLFDEICQRVGGGFVVAGAAWGTSANPGSTGGLYLVPGAGTVAVTNGSMSVTFEFPQTLLAGTVFAFVGAQPGALYALAANMSAVSTGQLTAPYTGVSNAASSWNLSAGA